MFKFNFDVEDVEEPESVVGPSPKTVTEDSHSLQDIGKEDVTVATFTEHSLADLLSTLPPAISFSPLNVPLSSARKPLTLARRDLFDARFQLISPEYRDDQVDTNSGLHLAQKEEDLKFLDAPSDLVPGVYEGGLKTWECSVDLVDCLDGLLGTDPASSLKGKRTLELGCGTAIPSLYVLHEVFSESTAELDDEDGVHLHLQDYNALVLRLVTVPNIILAWYLSPASLAFRTSAQDDGIGSDSFPPPDPTVPGTLSLTPALISAFLESLASYAVNMRFFSGSWESFTAPKIDDQRTYDIVLTSETIYRPDGLPALVRVIRDTCTKHTAEETEQALARLSLASPQTERKPESGRLCLVAAKRVYFGVGGGVAEFVRTVEDAGGRVDTIWKRTAGVNRVVLRVFFDSVGDRR